MDVHEVSAVLEAKTVKNMAKVSVTSPIAIVKLSVVTLALNVLAVPLSALLQSNQKMGKVGEHGWRAEFFFRQCVSTVNCTISHIFCLIFCLFLT